MKKYEISNKQKLKECLEEIRKEEQAEEQFKEYEQDLEIAFYNSVSEDEELFIPESFIKDTQQQMKLAEVVDTFTKKQKLLVQCYYYEKMTVDEIVQFTGMSKGSVQKSLLTIRTTIKEFMKVCDTNPRDKHYSIAAFPVLWLIATDGIAAWLKSNEAGEVAGKVISDAMEESRAVSEVIGGNSATAEAVGGNSTVSETIGGSSMSSEVETNIGNVKDSLNNVKETGNTIGKKIAKVAAKVGINTVTKGVIAGVVAMVALITGVVVFGGHRINMSDYVNVEYSGADGYATATCELDESILKELLGQDVKSVMELDSINDLGSAFMIEASVDLDLDKKENISNGDTITCTITVNKDLEKKYDFKATGLKKKIKVTGLEEAKVINPFDYAQISYSGSYYTSQVIAGAVTASVKNINKEDEFLKEISFSVTSDNNGKLKNGDKITVTAKTSQNPEENGYHFTETTKEYEVSGLSEYISDYSNISRASQETLKEKAKNKLISEMSSHYYSIRSSVENYKYSYFSFADPEYSGVELVDIYQSTAKDNSTSQNVNVYYVYKIANMHEGSNDPMDVYIPMSISDIVIDGSGNVVENPNYNSISWNASSSADSVDAVVKKLEKNYNTKKFSKVN